jgi:hypothetical protein
MDPIHPNIKITVDGMLKLWWNVASKNGGSIKSSISISDLCHFYGPVSIFIRDI